jgi:hypothetical protein
VKSLFKNGQADLPILALVGLLLALPHSVSAQSSPPNPDQGLVINPPPFDFNDAFYTANGISVSKLDTPAAGRFGLFRQTGPPAGPGQFNWVVDNSNTDPTRKNVRILATTGGYIDDTGAPTDFISIIAFLFDQTFFTGVQNKRGITMQSIVGSFEAYAGLKQFVNGVFKPQPCLASIGQTTDCFPVDSVATPRLRQDWRFATNRQAVDGSAPFGYFCDDVLGMWIITYFYYNATGFGPGQTAQCHAMLDELGEKNGISLDGTPIIKTGNELNFLEGKPISPSPIPGFTTPPNPGCAGEFNLDAGGADGGVVWLICPALPDPTQGGVAPDAFADVVRRPGGDPLDPDLSNNFSCLQRTGHFCPVVSGTYTVLNALSGLVWDDPNFSTTPGTKVQLFAPNGGTNQQWSFAANGDGTYTITNHASGLVLDDPNSSTAPETDLIQFPFNGGANQHWWVTPATNVSGFTIMNKASGLLVDASANTSQEAIDQDTPTAGAKQVWRLIRQ